MEGRALTAMTEPEVIIILASISFHDKIICLAIQTHNGLYKLQTSNFTGMTGPAGDTGAQGNIGMNVKDCFILALYFNISPISQFYSTIQ